MMIFIKIKTASDNQPFYHSHEALTEESGRFHYFTFIWFTLIIQTIKITFF